MTMMMVMSKSKSPVAPAKQHVSRKTTSKAEEGDEGRRDAAVVRRDGTFEISIIVLIIAIGITREVLNHFAKFSL